MSTLSIFEKSVGTRNDRLFISVDETSGGQLKATGSGIIADRVHASLKLSEGQKKDAFGRHNQFSSLHIHTLNFR